MAKAKRRRMRKRKPVNRGDRVEATPETIAKLQQDYLQHLLARDGIDHQEVEALLAIEQAWHTIERQFGAHRGWSMERGDGGGTHEMSDAVARVWAVWNCWATEVQRRTTVRGSVIASAIEQRIALDGINVELYRTAARIWHRCVRDAPPARPLQGQAIGGKPAF